ncbi:hypothetical protein COY32_03540 [candidate division WWE3 bacterium CG_4_10_14_0_2_um_filter_41_14]|uniref:HTH merR-type domain-containing protein n=1 Tax=candidate division WWE3 bacterium CG_4_10_14_0_2_um_filter_41_14 TaxID=1975072 RepID=A0A2M7TIY5_UNCKA|nr:MAG: hypothetical protein COY32_03540 [candidate division WWE3 bacterium CG_4_10_14_0_2_um_filter_41_14]
MGKLLSIQEAADFLGVNPETLRRWDRTGKLVAIKMSDRGDRKYRYEDLLKIKSGHEQEKYNGFDILPYSPGFELFTDRLGIVASFIVKNEGIMSVFAFAVGGLTMFAQPEISDDDLLKEAREIIKEHIDNKKVQHLEEYTFEYHSSNFIDVENPQWWTKTLKKYYGDQGSK